LTPVKATRSTVKKTVAKSDKQVTKVAKKVAKAVEIITKPTEAPAKKTVKKVAVKKTSPVKAVVAPKKSMKPVASTVRPEVEPAPALRRGRQPVNPEAEFAIFTHSFKVGAKVEGEVTAFTSHGAIITVKLRGAKHVECYAPTTMLGSPAPARARDVLKRGDVKTFTLRNVDAERRIAELALS
jgi:transcriptional accessory protein Tex/SPT6